MDSIQFERSRNVSTRQSRAENGLGKAQSRQVEGFFQAGKEAFCAVLCEAFVNLFAVVVVIVVSLLATKCRRCAELSHSSARAAYAVGSAILCGNCGTCSARAWLQSGNGSAARDIKKAR